MLIHTVGEPSPASLLRLNGSLVLLIAMALFVPSAMHATCNVCDSGTVSTMMDSVVTEYASSPFTMNLRHQWLPPSSTDMPRKFPRGSGPSSF